MDHGWEDYNLETEERLEIKWPVGEEKESSASMENAKLFWALDERNRLSHLQRSPKSVLISTLVPLLTLQNLQHGRNPSQP